MNNKGNKILLYLMLFQKNRIGVNQLKRKFNLMKLLQKLVYFPQIYLLRQNVVIDNHLFIMKFRKIFPKLI